jgi:single-strand DNA-binding protein
MNKVILIGRLTDNPEVRYSNKGDEALAVARYRLAVDRIGEGADFISCVAFGKQGEFAEKYLKKGTKVAVEGRIQTGSYEKDGKKVYTTDIVVERHEFCERRSEEPPKSEGEFIDAVEDKLPFGQRR